MASSTTSGTALSYTQNVLELLCKGAAGCGVVGVESAANLALGIIQQLKKVKENDSTCKGLIDQINALAKTLQSALDTIKALGASSDSESAAVLGSSAELTDRIDNTLRVLERVKADAEGLKTVGRRWKLLKATPNSERLRGMADDVKIAQDIFSSRGQISIELLLHRLHVSHQHEVIEARLAREHQAEAQARELRHREEMDAIEAQRRLEKDLRALLDRLPHADAGYSASIHSCHHGALRGTRVALLGDLDNWSTRGTSSQDYFPFYVLTGGAGTGKSTIAYEVADRAKSRNQLAASFFFMRGAAELSSTELVFPTLAWQMLSSTPDLRSHRAVEILTAHLQFGTLHNLDIQAQHLFVDLLATLPSDHSPLIIVIDAVDECTAVAQDRVQRILFLMMDGLAKIACPVRVFVTSRPELHVEDALASVTFDKKLQRFWLHKVPRPQVDADIKLYFEAELAKLPILTWSTLLREHRDVIAELTALAAGLFIYATTLVHYLGTFIGEEILDGVSPLLDDHRAPKSALEQLGALYTVVLNNAFPPDVRDSPVSGRSMKAVLGCIAVLQDHISPCELAKLTGIHLQRGLLPTLRRLATVISFDEHDLAVPMRPLHASFADFLVDPALHMFNIFLVNPFEQHKVLATHSLVLIMQHGVLKDALVQLRSRGAPAPSDGSHVPAHYSTDLSSSVTYACRFWPVHVAALHIGNRQSRDADSVQATARGVIEAFFLSEYVVPWMEVLAYLAQLHVVAESLDTIRDILSVADDPSISARSPEEESSDANHVLTELREVVDDCYRLIVEFLPAFLADPRQFMVSAVPQCRTTSRLTRHVSPNYPVPRMVLPRSNWPPWTDAEIGPPAVMPGGRIRVLPSPDGAWLAVYAVYEGPRVHPDVSGDVYLCDSKTGHTLRVLHCHAYAISDMDISANSRLIVTVSRGDVHITDARSGSLLHRHHNIKASFVAFCRGGHAILMATYTCAMTIWDFAANPPMFRDVKISDLKPTMASSLTSSPDGLWALLETSTGAVLVNLHREVSTKEEEECILGATFFFNELGGRIATFLGSDCVLVRLRRRALFTDRLSVELHDLNRGTSLRSDFTSEQEANIAASRDGSLVVIIHPEGGDVYVWDPTTNASNARLLEYKIAGSAAVSPTGGCVYLVSETGIRKNLCRIIDLRVRRSLPLFNRGETYISCSVSADLSTFAVAESRDRIIVTTVYRASDGAVIFRLDPFLAKYDRQTLRHVALSTDGRLLVQILDSEITVWDRDGSILVFQERRGQFSAGEISYDGSRLVAVGSGYTGGLPVLRKPLRVREWTLHGTDISPDPSLDIELECPGRLGKQPFRVVLVPNSPEIFLTSVDGWGNTHRFVVDHRDWNNSMLEGSLVPIPRLPGERYMLQRDGWVTRADGVSGSDPEKLCWIPPSRRSDDYTCVGHILLSSTPAGEPAIVDLSAFNTE